MRYLRADTSVKVVLGPFVDASDGFTPETTVNLSAADFAEIVKHDGSAVVDLVGSTFAAITSADGLYNLTLDTSHTDTEGMFNVYIGDTSLCRPIMHEFEVLAAAVYDSLIAGTDALQVDTIQISGDATAADNLEEAANGIVPVVVSTSSTTTTVVTTLTETTNDHYNGGTLVFLTGALAGQRVSITDYNGSTKTLTVGTMTEAPSNLDTAVIV